MVDIEAIGKDFKLLNLDKGYLYINGSWEDNLHLENLEEVLRKHGLLRSNSKYYYDGWTKSYEKSEYLQVWIEEE